MSLTRWSMCCAVLGALICGWQAVVSGFSLDWDLLNYHLYNPWAWLQGRALDIAPGQLQTYFNPLLHLPYLLGFLYLPQHWLLFLTGAVQGLQLGLLYALAWQVLPPSARRPWVCLPLAVLGLAGPIFRAELGVSQGDTLLSLPLLVVLLLLLPTLRAGGASWRAVLCAGLLAGITVALKLTMAVYVAGLGVALLLAASSGQQLRLATVFGLGATAGLLLAGGWWMLRLWQDFANPLFPYFNEHFASPWARAVSFRDLRFLPTSPGEALLYPFVWLADPQRVWEWNFRDIRPVLLYPLLLVLPVLFWKRWRVQAPELLFLYLFLLVTLAAWMGLFSIYRYLGLFEMLAPLALFAAACQFVRRKRLLLLALVLLATTQARVASLRWPSSTQFTPQVPAALTALPGDAAVMLTGYQPLAYVALWLDNSVPIWRIRSNLMTRGKASGGLRELAMQRLQTFTGPVFLLRSRLELEAPWMAADLTEAGFDLPGEAECHALFDSAHLQAQLQVEICALARPATALDQ
jgi:flagellar biosynthesis protein FliQ